MNKKFGKGRFNGPIFPLQPKNFEFDGEKADREEDYLKNKMKEIGVPGKFFFFMKNRRFHIN